MAVFSSLFALLAAYPQVVDYLMCRCCFNNQRVTNNSKTSTLSGGANQVSTGDLKYGKLSTSETSEESA
jgi:hypothetical protein